MLSQHERNQRRAKIVRRWAAHRIGQAQREIWKKRRQDASGSFDGFDEGVGSGSEDHDLLSGLPDGLLG